jgi:hypothetical protein
MFHADNGFRQTSSHDSGATVFIAWIAVFAVFVVALMALGGDGHLLTAHRMVTPAPWVGPA